MPVKDLYPTACAHPWYADRFLPDGSLPILTKGELYAALQGRETDPFFAHGTYWSPSGGSGATPPLLFPTAVEENLEQRRILSRWLRSEGILGPEVVALNLFSSRCMYRACEIFVDYVQLCGGTVLPVTYGASDEQVTQIWQRFRPNTLLGSPGRLVQWAHSLPQPVRFERVLYASERLTRGAQELLDVQLSGPRWSSVIGSAEAGVWGFSRADDAREQFWAPLSLVQLEIADPDAEGFGRLIVSNRVRRRHPLLRYDTGDRARLTPRYHPDLVGVEFAGRHGQSFQFSCQSYSLDDFAEVLSEAAAFQFVLRFERCDWLTLRLVASEGAAARALDLLRLVVRADARVNRVEVQRVEPAALKSTADSGKVLPILDLRS